MEMNAIFQHYAENRQKLQTIFDDARQLFTELDARTELQQMIKTADTLNRDSFKVLVVGEFKRGKSTFINALLGEEVLPAFATPCTAVINEIKYSEEKKAVLHFAENLPEQMPELAPDVAKHIEQYRGKGPIPPMEIPVDRIEEFVVIPDPGKDQAESIAESPFSLVEIFWPIDLCKNRVEIIDSPGLNEHGTRTKVTTDYLSHVDAVIFVLSCSALASQSEMQVISDSIIASGHEEIFFVCNRFDEVRERERPRVMDYAQKRLADKTTLENGIHFLSALNALDAKLDHDDSALERSGFPDLEKDLITFLVDNKGHLKLLRPASALKRQIRTLIRETIPMQKQMLSTDMTELQAKYEEEKPRLEDAEKRRFLIREKLNEKSIRIKESMRRETRAFISNLAYTAPDLIKTYQTQAKVTFLSLQNHKRQCEDMVKELLTLLEADLARRQKEWAQTVLAEMQNQIQDMADSARPDLKQFQDAVDDIKLSLSCNSITADQRDVPAWERGVATGLGFVLFGVGGIFQAGQDGFKGLCKSLTPLLAVWGATVVLGVTNPWIIIPALLGAGSLSAIFSNMKIEDKLREKLGEEVKDSLLKAAEEQTENAVGKIAESLDAIITQVDNGMKHEIETIRENVENILQIKKDGEDKARAKEQFLVAATKRAESLIDAIDEFAETV